MMSFFLPLPSYAFGIQKWQDANGDTIYGDNPPRGQTSQSVNLPPITVIEALPTDNQAIYQNSYANNRSMDRETAKRSPNDPANYSTSNPSFFNEINRKNESPLEDETLERDLQLMTPKHDQAIRANNGNVTVIFKTRPALQNGERLVLYVDERQKMAGEQTHFTLEQLDRGTHTVFGVWQDRKGNTLAKSQAISFHVLRFSILHPKASANSEE
ncbi:MAG: DUF4124 domain-containing protein [bacterium]